MTTPDIFSDVTGTANNKFVWREEPQGNLSQKAIATVPASTATATNIALIRFAKGFSLTGLAIVSADLDTGSNLTLDVGYIYDDDTSFTNDTNAFLDGLDIGQDAGSRTWPVDDGLLTGVSFIADGPGYLTVTTADQVTITAGDITAIAEFTYDL